MFCPYGRVVEIRLNRDRMTGRCKGYAFVAMGREEEVDEVRGHGGGAVAGRAAALRPAGCVTGTAVCLCLPLPQCIRRLDRISINGYRITVERAKTDR